MSTSTPLPYVAGVVDALVGQWLVAGYFAEPATLEGLQPSVTDAPASGGSVTVELAVEQGGPSLTATIQAGQRVPPFAVSGTIPIPAGSTLYMRVTAATGSAIGLGGFFFVGPAAGSTTEPSPRAPLPVLPGSVDAHVGQSYPAGYFAEERLLTELQPSLIEAPSGGAVTVTLSTAPGGGGVGLTAVIPDGELAPAAPVTGSVTIPAGSRLYLYVAAATGGAVGLAGLYRVDLPPSSTDTPTTRPPLPRIAGDLTPHVGVDFVAGYFATAGILVGLQPSVTDPPAPGGGLTLELRTAQGGAGAGLAAAIAAGDTEPPTAVEGTVAVAAGTTLYMRITSASGAPMNLSGQYLVEASADVLPALTTLDKVKRYLRIAGNADDVLLNELIAAVSVKMQRAMRRSIVESVIVGERHSCDGQLLALQLEEYPVISGTVAVTMRGTAIDPTLLEIDTRVGQVFYRPGGIDADPSPWPRGMRHLSVSYSAGYAEVPADICAAATVQVAWEFKRTSAAGGALGQRTTVIDDNTQTFLIDAWAPDVVPVLRAYERGPF